MKHVAMLVVSLVCVCLALSSTGEAEAKDNNVKAEPMPVVYQQTKAQLLPKVIPVVTTSRREEIACGYYISGKRR